MSHELKRCYRSSFKEVLCILGKLLSFFSNLDVLDAVKVDVIVILQICVNLLTRERRFYFVPEPGIQCKAHQEEPGCAT